MIFSTAELRGMGRSARQISAAVDSGELIRVRLGWFVTTDTDPESIEAVRRGGSVVCVSALRKLAVWTPDRSRHVRIDPHARVHGSEGEATIHRLPGTSRHGVDDLESALLTAMNCVSGEEAVAILDSVLHLGLMTRNALRRCLQRSVPGRRALARTDRSEPGIESLVRVRLRALGLILRTQVSILGIARVDLLIGDRLIIEVDGDEWHSSPAARERDRRKTAALVALGYVVFRVGYRRVMFDWPGFEAEVLAVIRRRDHHWRAVHHVGREG